MNKLLLACTAFALCMFSSTAVAQVTGIQTVPGSFPSIQAAVAALNATGVGPGGATINVAAGYTETPTGALVLNMPINGPSAGNPLVIQKSGAGANPLITAFTPGVSTTLDGIFVLAGADYITIDGIDLQENAANTTATMQMEWGFALVKTGATNGASFNTIKNCTVTLNKSNTASVGIYLGNHTAASTTALTVASTSGTSSNNKFYNNTVQNAYTGISMTGYSSVAPFDLYDQGNQVGVDGVSTRRNQVINYGGAATTANGIFATNQSGIKVFKTYINNNGGASSTGPLNGISLVAGTNVNVDVYNDTLTLSSASTTGSTLIGISNGMGATGAGSTVNIYNNVVDGCTYATNTSGEFRGISSTATATYTNMYNNRVTNNIIPGTGNFSALFYSGSSVTICLAVNINGNTVSGNSKTGTAGSFRMIMADVSTVATNVYNNQLYNNSCTASTGSMHAYYNFNGVGLAENIYNNTIYNNAGGTGETVMLYVSAGAVAGSIAKQVFGNTIYGISGNTAGSSVGAIYIGYGMLVNVNNNVIYDITNNTTAGITGAVVGINIANFLNQQVSIYNNFISELKAPFANNTNAAYGIWLQGTSISAISVYYNTVYLNSTSAGANFGTAAIACTTAPASIDMRNNILVNVSTPTGTGTTRALLRAGISLTNYATTSGYNCLYAGTPGPSNLIFSDGTNNDQQFQAFKNRVGPREQSSFAVLPPFVNVAVSPYDLHVQTSVATQCQGGAAPIAGYTLDYDGNVRNATTPDVGADEFAGITTDIAAPNIQYTLLTNSSVAANRPCTNFATITDPSGINTTIGTRPRMYYKRSTNANTYNNNTNGTDGWKYVEATNTSSPFSFTIDYSLLFGGGVVAGDVIQYFVVAQDLAGTPIVGINNGGFTVQPTNVNLTAANFPLNNTINQYTIVAAALSGTINVGPSELITSLTNAGGIFQAINASTLSGNLTINITGDLTAETGTFALNQWAEEGTGGYTVSIVPSAATTRNIYGSSAAATLIRFDGADRVNIDGRFASAGSYLMFRNTSNAAPTIGFLNDARNNTVQYTIIESGNTSTSTTLGGAVWIGITTGPDGNDNITLSNCEIRDRSDLTGAPNFAINCQGTSTGTVAQYNDNLVVSNCNIHDWFLLNGTAQYAINVGVGNSGFTITGNSFYQTTTRTTTVAGAGIRAINISFAASMATNGGHQIIGNFIGGSAPGATGSDMTLTVSGVGVSQQFGGISLTTGLIPNSIQGNVIRRVDFTTNAPTGAATVWFGMNLGQGIHNVGTTTGNTMGDGAITGSLKITINAGGAVSSFLAGFLAATVNGSYVIQNNTIAGITIAGSTVAGPIIPQWIQIQGTPSANTVITGNTIGSTTVANSIQNNATGAAAVSFAVRHLTTTGCGAVISNNTIQNITDNSTNVSSGSYGVLLITGAGTGSTGVMTVTNNTIRDITMAGGATTPVLANMGISVQGFSGTNHTFSNNLIAGLHCSNTGAAQNYAVGIQVQGNAMGGVMNANRIFDIRNSNTGANPGIMGIYMSAGLNWTLSNNMISITNGTNTNLVDMGGIVEFLGQSAVINLYYNSIYLGGSTGSGALSTACYQHAGNSTVTLRNNLLYNKRTGGTGFHVALANTSGTPTAGWQGSSSNYNAFIVSDTTRVGIWVATVHNMSGWRNATSGDATSIWETSTAVSSAALFVNPNNGNLHINTSTYPEALGTPLTAVITDYDGNPRSPSFPTIGADELACSAIAFGVSSQTNVLCNGGANGSATVNGTGGNGITYSWAPSGGNAATATGLSAGTYTVNISNICGSIGAVTVTITEPAVLAVAPTQTNVTCNGANDGTATATVSGGTGPYNYLWSPTGGTGVTESSLAPGAYTCLITDANSCTTTQTFSITEPAVLAATTMQTNILCNGSSTGDAMVMVTGGTTSYSYAWSPSGGTSAMATGLAAGTYTCLITDANNCTLSESFTLTEPPALTSTNTQTDLSCNGSGDGDATVSVTGGTGGYTYSWSPSGGTSATATGLTAGTYTCLITDANNCTLSESFTLTEPLVLASTNTQTDVTCNASADGDATVSVTGGTGPYTYSWSPSGGTGATATGLSPGVYTCMITDANNCTLTETFNITEPSPLSATATTATGPTTCGGSDGSIDLTVSGGTGPFTFIWINSDVTEDISGLIAGVYSVIIHDANNCIATDTTTLSDPPLPVVTLTLPIDTACTTTTAPFALTGESPAGGTFTGPGVNAGIFDPNQANIGMNGITYTYTDPNGCSAFSVDSIYVDLCMGVPTVNNGNFVVYPNPNSGSFTIQLNTSEAADVVIYDALGQLVSTQKVQPKMQQQITIESSGAYLVTVVTADGQRTTQRVIVTR